MQQATPDHIDHWRQLAGRFPAVATLVRCGYLPEAYEPADLVALLAQDDSLAESWRGVLRFLLHTWNIHDPPCSATTISPDRRQLLLPIGSPGRDARVQGARPWGCARPRGCALDPG